MIRRQSALWNFPHSPLDLQGLLSQLGMFLSVAGMVTAMATGLGGSSAPDDPGSYQPPGLEEQLELEEIRNDINLAIKQLRHDEMVPPVVMDPIDLQREAQAHAEEVAVAGELKDSAQNVTMLQHHLPKSEASGYAFLDVWLHSEAHTDVLLDPNYIYYGIGIAVGHDRVWVAVQFSGS